MMGSSVFQYRILTLFFVFYNFLLEAATQLALSVHAESAILVNVDTGAVLYEKNPHTHHYPASITKIVTALYALQRVSDQMDVVVIADQDCVGTVTEDVKKRSNYSMASYVLTSDCSNVGIKRGDEIPLRDLFYGMMLKSGCDSSNMIAKYAGGTIPQFMDELNAYLQQLGCRDSFFCNPHGLHHPNQHTTAHDMALITREALKNPIFREIVGSVRYTCFGKKNKQAASVFMQSNKLLRPGGPYYYSKAIGVKTGYYSLAQNTLVAAAKDGERTLVAVLLKTQERKDTFLDAKKMFEAAFGQPKVQRTLLHRGIQKFTLQLDGAEWFKI